MKVSRKRFNNIIRKGMAVMLSASMVLTAFMPGNMSAVSYAYADTPSLTISSNVSEEYLNYMAKNGYSYSRDKKEDIKDNVRLGRVYYFTKFLNKKLADLGMTDQYYREYGELVDVPLNPSQETIDRNNYQLYMLEWVNGMENMGSGFNLFGRIVYVTNNGDIKSTTHLELDYYARDFTDLTYGNQFDKNRPNQCTFALPHDCRQILGIMLYKDEGGGDDDDPWNMSKLTITRIKDDSLNNIGAIKKNSNGFNYRQIKAGELHASVTSYDIIKAFLGQEGYREWLYLLQPAKPLTDYISDVPVKENAIISQELIKEFRTYMFNKRDDEYKRYDNYYFNKDRRGRASALVSFLNENSSKTGLPQLSLKNGEYGIKWNPSQSDIDKNNYNLYLLEWVNYEKNDPGSGFMLLGRVVFLTNDGKLVYSEEVSLDKQARDFTDLNDFNQFDVGRPNQCTFALPNNCQQVLGLMLYKEPGGGDDDNPWNMSKLTITRVENDKLSNIASIQKNENGFNYRKCMEGYVEACVSQYDMDQAYLGDEASQEWLYLLQPSIVKRNDGNYVTAMRITNGSVDLKNAKFDITMDYTDNFGYKRTEKKTISANDIKNFYPKLIYTTDFTPYRDEVSDYIKDKNNLFYSVVLDHMDSILAGAYFTHNTGNSGVYSTVVPLPSYVANGNFKNKTFGDYSIVNKIAMEVLKENGHDSGDILRHLMDYGDFKDYDWDTADTTETNLYAGVYFGNFINYDAMVNDFMGPYTATDFLFETEYPVGIVDKLTISQSGNATGGVNLQNFSVYLVGKNQFGASTRMNGGMSTERIFDIEDAILLAEVNAPKGIQFTGNAPVVCQPDSSLSTRNDYELITYVNGPEFDNFAEDDYLGIEIDIADIFEAGIETFAARNENLFREYTDEELGTPSIAVVYDYKDYWIDGGYTFGDKWWSSSDTFYGDSAYLVSLGLCGFFQYVLADPLNSTSDIKEYIFNQLVKSYRNYSNGDLISNAQAFSILNLMDAYYKDPIILNVTYLDQNGSRRVVEVPFVTAYMLQIYSDAEIGTNAGNHLMGVLQQGEEVGLRIPLSLFEEVVDIELEFCGTSTDISNFRSNKFFYEPTQSEIAAYQSKIGNVNTNKSTYELILENEYSSNPRTLVPYSELGLKENETIRGGTLIPTYDTLSIRSVQIYEGVTKNNFNTSVPNKHVTKLNKPADADYHYSAVDYKGTLMTAGSTLKLSTGASGLTPTLTAGSAPLHKEDYNNFYLVEIIGKKLNAANSAQDLDIQFTYTTTAGEQITTNVTALSVLSQDYYGTKGNYKDLTETFHTGKALDSGKAYYTVHIDGVKTFDSITVEIPDGYSGGWQINEINVIKLTDLTPRTTTDQQDYDFTKPHIFVRDYEGRVIAFNNKPIALQTAGSSKTFYFTIVNEDGSLKEPESQTKDDSADHIITNPVTMTYEETLKNLGLSSVKYQYDIRVDVADITDAGSGNYFYFQLVFEHGTSAVVLANQQLASDSFRQGQSESFIIKTTQNYGELKGIRIICDASSANNQTFDKLNIDTVTVSLANKGGIRSWIIENIGWIDINYRDEGVSNSVTATLEDQGFTNDQVVNEFTVTRQATAARLLFNITTSASSSTKYIAQDGKFEGVLTYLDTAGATKTYNFDLISRIEEFNGTADRTRMLRPNMSNYFSLMLTDISSVKSLTIYRSNGSDSWMIHNVVISQISETKDVYLSNDGEYKRYIDDEVHLADSANINQEISATGSGSFTFPEHKIEVKVNVDNPDSWTTTISRIPSSNKDSFNVYLLPGGNYSFSESKIPDIQGVLDYTFKTGNNLGQEAFTFNDTGEINGTTVLKSTAIKITDMNVLKKLHLKYNGGSTNAPVVAGAKVERIRDNTIIETYYFDFLSQTLTRDSVKSALAMADTTATDTMQTLVLQPSEGQNHVLIPSTSDVAIALLYRSENDADAQTAYYSSPYQFLTDAQITLINNAMPLEIPYDIDGVSKVVGIAVIGSGPNVKFDNAMVYNYVNNSRSESLLNVCEIPEGFTVDTSKKTFLASENTNVSPVTFTFHTSSDDNFAGAGASGTIPITINYTDINGSPAQFKISRLSDYLPANTVPSEGSKVSFTVMLNNFAKLDSMNIAVENDSWHLTKVVADITTTYTSSSGKDRLVTVQREAYHDNWITVSKPGEIIFNNGDDAEIVRNELINLSVSGRATFSGNSVTAGAGNALNLNVYSGDSVTLTPNVTVNGKPDTTVVWDKSKYSAYMTEGTDGKLTFKVPAGASGTTYTFDAYCKADKTLWVTVALTIVDPSEEGASGDSSVSLMSTISEPKISATIETPSGLKKVTFGVSDHNRIYVVEVPKGTTATYKVAAVPTDSSPVGTNINYDTNYVVFDNTNNNSGDITRKIKCSSTTGDFNSFEVTVKYQVV